MENDYRYIPIKRGLITQLYPWNFWYIDFLTLFPFLYINKSKKDKILQDLKYFYHTDNIFFLDSGKSALVTSMKALGIKEGNEVYIQSFVCTDVVDAIIMTGAQPVLIDCTDNLLINASDFEKKITSKGKCLVITNTYGYVEKSEIYQIARKYNLKVIDDCAQLAEIKKDFSTQKKADFSVYSVGTQKLFATTGGGIITTNQKELAESVNFTMPNQIISYTSLVRKLILRLSYSFKFLLLRIQDYIKIKVIHIAKEKTPYDHQDPESIRPKKMNIRTIYSLYLKSVRSNSHRDKTRQNIKTLNDYLKKFEWIKLPQREHNDTVLYYTITVANEIRYKLGEYLSKYGFQSTWNYMPVNWYMAYKKYRGETPNSFYLSGKVLSLPFRDLSDLNIKEMISVIDKFEKTILNSKEIKELTIKDWYSRTVGLSGYTFFSSMEWVSLTAEIFNLTNHFLVISDSGALIYTIVQVDKNGLGYSTFIGYGGLITDNIISDTLTKRIYRLIEDYLRLKIIRIKDSPFIEKTSCDANTKNTSAIKIDTGYVPNKNIRYFLKKVNYNVVSIRKLESNEIDSMYDLYLDTSLRVKSAYTTPKELFKSMFTMKDVYILGGFDEKQKLHAASIFMYDNQTMYYWWNMSDDIAKKEYYNYALIYHAIELAVQQKLNWFDMATSHSETLKVFKKSWGAIDVPFLSLEAEEK